MDRDPRHPDHSLRDEPRETVGDERRREETVRTDFEDGRLPFGPLPTTSPVPKGRPPPGLPVRTSCLRNDYHRREDRGVLPRHGSLRWFSLVLEFAPLTPLV